MNTNKPIAFHIAVRSPGFGHLVAECAHNKHGHCKWSIGQHPAANGVWQWDGNTTAPTINPSIDCQGGCGRHFTLTGGVFSGIAGILKKEQHHG